jgi:hypothetical protein
MTSSAVRSVQHCGLELVRRRKQRGKLATAHDYAKADWKSWEAPEPGKLLPPSSETMNNLTVTARFAYGIMTKSRSQLVEMHRTIEHETIDLFMGNLAQGAEDLKVLAQMLESAYTRILAAGSRHALAGGKFKFRNGSSRKARSSEL